MRLSFFGAALSIIFSTTCGLNAQCRFAKTNAKTSITYRFQPEISPGSLVLHVAMEFKAGADGTQTLELPLQWAGETLHSMTNLRVVSKNASLADTGHSSLRVVHTSPNHRVVIRYDLQKDWPGPLVNPMQFHPVLTPGYFEFTGSNALVALKVDKSARETANFDWQQLPRHGHSRPALVTPRQRRVGARAIPEHGERSTKACTQPEITVFIISRLAAAPRSWPLGVHGRSQTTMRSARYKKSSASSGISGTRTIFRTSSSP